MTIVSTHEEFRSRICNIEEKISDIINTVSPENKPWYRNVPTIISSIALIFSLGTTYVSYKRTVDQDIQTSRVELQGFLQRLSVLPEKNIETHKKYADDPVSRTTIAGFIAQENNLLSKQAAETLSRIPINRVTSTDYYAVGLGLQNNRDFDRAIIFISQAATLATTLDDEVNSLRALGALQYLTGRIGDGRNSYQKALDIFSKYRGYDLFNTSSTHVLTELTWAFSEANSGFVENANQHLAQADGYAAKISSGPGQQLIISQIAGVRQQISLLKEQNVSPAIIPIPPLPATPQAPQKHSQN